MGLLATFDSPKYTLQISFFLYLLKKVPVRRTVTKEPCLAAAEGAPALSRLPVQSYMYAMGGNNGTASFEGTIIKFVLMD